MNEKNFFFSVDSLLDTVLKYYLFIPIIIFTIGFIYVQGVFSPFTKFWMNPFPNVSVIPISTEAYIANGLYFIGILIIQSIIAYILWTAISKIVDKAGDYRNKWVRHYRQEFKKKSWYHKIFVVLIDFLFASYVLFPVLYLFLLIKILPSEKYLYMFLYDIGFILILLCCFYFFEKDLKDSSKELDISKIRGGRLNALYFILVLLITSLINIYCNGLFAQGRKVDAVTKGNDSFEFSRVYTSFESPKIFYKMDISKDFFIGYDFDAEKIIYIPMSKINKIEKSDIASKDTKQKYISDQKYLKAINTEALPPEQMSIVNTIQNFYKYRVDIVSMDASKFFNLVTENYYISKCNLISPDIAQRAWKNKLEYNGKDLKGFYGYEMSVPVKIGTGYQVFVIKYWGDFNDYISYKLVFENNDYRIDDIKNNEKAFKFSK